MLVTPAVPDSPCIGVIFGVEELLRKRPASSPMTKALPKTMAGSRRAKEPTSETSSEKVLVCR